MQVFNVIVLAAVVGMSVGQYLYEPVAAPVAAPYYEAPLAVPETPVYTYNSYLPVAYNSPVAAAAYPYAYALYGSNKGSGSPTGNAPPAAGSKSPSPSQ
uniref:Secreted protein n=1 Tax=Panagrellus redivivus TaxID=6233 RepID=A0A7E4ZX87_PANRE